VALAISTSLRAAAPGSVKWLRSTNFADMVGDGEGTGKQFHGDFRARILKLLVLSSKWPRGRRPGAVPITTYPRARALGCSKGSPPTCQIGVELLEARQLQVRSGWGRSFRWLMKSKPLLKSL
jgi:hypothetical protein